MYCKKICIGFCGCRAVLRGRFKCVLHHGDVLPTGTAIAIIFASVCVPLMACVLLVFLGPCFRGRGFGGKKHKADNCKKYRYHSPGFATVEETMAAWFQCLLKRNVVILTKFSSLVTPKIVILTTFGEASNQNFAKTTTLPFQCWKRHMSYYSPLWGETIGDRWIPLTKGQ